MFDSDVERRVLGHLPVWTADENAFRVEEGENSIRSYSLPELTVRLRQDACIPARTEEQVQAFLSNLAAKGLVSETDGAWVMTEAGLRALVDVPGLSEHEQTRGPVQIGLSSPNGVN
jgi:hypothetical protein